MTQSTNTEDLARRIRVNAVNMVDIQGFGYLGQALGTAEIMAVIFGEKYWRQGVDRFVLSPGHYAITFYAVAAEIGLLPREALADYGKDEALLEAISTERTPIVDITCGSLAQGLSGGIGLALAQRFAGDGGRTIALISDGEMEEGQTWEAAMFAAHHKVNNLIAVMDVNNSQVDGPVTFVTTVEPIADKWRAFGWNVIECDGHDVGAIREGMDDALASDRPTVILAKTDILGGLTSFPPTVDGHFIKLTPDLTRNVLEELSAEPA